MAKRTTIHPDVAVLWESGEPLSSAWLTFAAFVDPFDLQALKVDPDDPDNPEDEEYLRKHPRYEQIKHWLPSTREARLRKLQSTTRNLRVDLLNAIYAGELWAIGRRSLADGFDEPARVPRERFYFDEENDIWPGIDWDKAALPDDAESYLDVRIVHATIESAESEPTHAGDTAESQTTKGAWVGRPNKSDQIREMVEELWKSGEFQGLRNRLEQAEEVRARLKGKKARHHHEMAGYKDSTIMRIIGEVASSRKSTE